MRTAAATEVRRPSAVRPLTTPLAFTAAATVVVDLPFCWLLLGVDGLVLDGAPQVAAGLAFYELWRDELGGAQG